MLLEEKLDLIINKIKSLDRRVAELRMEIQSANSLINSTFDNLETMISDLHVNLAVLNTRIDHIEESNSNEGLPLFKAKTVH